MNPNTDRNWTFVNECSKHHKKVPNLSEVTTSYTNYNYTIAINHEDTLNAITVSLEGQVVIQEFGIPYVRVKHDSVLVFSGIEFIFIHLCTGYICRFTGPNYSSGFHSADVFYDPLTCVCCLWVWDGSYITSHLLDGTVKSHPVTEHSDGYMHVLDNITCVYSSRTRMSIYNNGALTHEKNNPKRTIKQISYLYNIDKYFVQNDRYFVIVHKNEINTVFDDDLLRFDSDGIVYFTKYQDIVMYGSNKHLCIAQTTQPYRISLVRLGDTLRHFHFCDTKLRVQTLKNTHFFSMFPISLTDSTNMDTTFE